MGSFGKANNSKAPMWLRVNRKHHTRTEYQVLLDQENIEYTFIQKQKMR